MGGQYTKGEGWLNFSCIGKKNQSKVHVRSVNDRGFKREGPSIVEFGKNRYF